jgi:hypothetical protein
MKTCLPGLKTVINVPDNQVHHHIEDSWFRLTGSFPGTGALIPEPCDTGSGSSTRVIPLDPEYKEDPDKPISRELMDSSPVSPATQYENENHRILDLIARPGSENSGELLNPQLNNASSRIPVGILLSYSQQILYYQSMRKIISKLKREPGFRISGLHEKSVKGVFTALGVYPFPFPLHDSIRLYRVPGY